MDENENEALKEQWLKDMHYCEPGFNWQNEEMKFRMERANRLSSLSKRSSVNLANGSLKGYFLERGSANQAGRVHLSEYDSVRQILYTASAGGNIWKSTLAGNNWEVLNDKFRIPNIIGLKILHLNGTHRIVVVSGSFGLEGVFYTDNEGKEWKTAKGLENMVKWGNIQRVVFSPYPREEIYLLVQEWDYSNWGKIFSLYYSDDYSETFKKIQSFRADVYGSVNNMDIWTDPISACPLYFLIADSLFSLSNKSLDFISTIPSGLSGSKYLSGSHYKGKTRLYLAVSQSKNTDIYLSVDEGYSWTRKGSVEEKPFRRTSFICSHERPHHVYLGGVNGYLSYNQGETWNKVNNWYDYYGAPEVRLHADIPSINIFYINHKEYIFVNTDGGTYFSTDSLANVKNLSLMI